MSATLHSLVHNFMIPTLHCERIKSCAFVGNHGSRKVHVSRAKHLFVFFFLTYLASTNRPIRSLGAQEKFGFRTLETYYATPNPAIRGREKEQWLFEWRSLVPEEASA